MFNFGKEYWLTVPMLKLNGKGDKVRSYTAHYCPNCDYESIITHKYCPNCGIRLHRRREK